MEPEYKGYYIYTQDGTCNLFCIFEKIYSNKIKSKLGLNQMDRARFIKWIKGKKVVCNCVQRDEGYEIVVIQSQGVRPLFLEAK